MKKGIVLLLLCLSVSCTNEKTIVIDASKNTHTVSDKLNGANVEDLNYQGYGGMYSQLLHGQDFQEFIDVDFLNLPTEVTDLKSMRGPLRYTTFIVLDENGKPYLQTQITETKADGINAEGYPVTQPYEINSKSYPKDIRPLDSLSKDVQKMILERVNSGKQISRYWREVNSGSAKSIFKLINKGQYKGRRSQVMKFVSGSGEVGLDNMGLYRMGINLEEGKNYEGLLRIKNQQKCNLYVALLSADGKEKLAEKEITINASPATYQKIEFELIPAKSDHKGRFAIILKEPGEVILGHAFLQPGLWGRVKGGYPIRQAFIDQIKNNGMMIIRYNGSMTSNASDSLLYMWKYMIGPRDERITYTGCFNPYASHSFGIFEFLMATEAAGIDGVVGISKYEDPGEIKNMIEYANGPVTSRFGALRAKDGHPDPLNLKYIEIHNGAGANAVGLSAYFDKFKPLATEIWKADPDMLIMAPINVRANLAKLKKGDQANQVYNVYRDFLKWVQSQGKENQFAQEIHYSGSAFSNDSIIYNSLGLALQKFISEDIGYKLKLYPMEENGPHHIFERGLVHAYLQNHINRWGDKIEAAATANLFQPEAAFLTWSQGRIFFDSYRFWNQTSGHVDQMYTKEWLPKVLDIQEQLPADSLDVLVKTSDNGKVISMYVVNYGLQLQSRSIKFAGFKPTVEAQVTQLGPYPFTARNSGENPDLIKPVVTTKTISTTGFKYDFPGHSFIVIRMEKN